MRIEVNMTTDENKFRVDSWWATSPAFVIDSMERQLAAAAAIWPELANIKLATEITSPLREPKMKSAELPSEEPT